MTRNERESERASYRWGRARYPISMCSKYIVRFEIVFFSLPIYYYYWWCINTSMAQNSYSISLSCGASAATYPIRRIYWFEGINKRKKKEEEEENQWFYSFHLASAYSFIWHFDLWHGASGACEHFKAFECNALPMSVRANTLLCISSKCKENWKGETFAFRLSSSFPMSVWEYRTRNVERRHWTHFAYLHI